MKSPRHLIYAVSFALALATSPPHATAENKLPAPKPEFLNSEQLAEWRAKKTAEFETKKAQEVQRRSVEADVFYTGKPYLEDSGTYAFLFRSYDPELARWTSADPSGFPDGPNLYFRAGSPTKTFDALGLWYDEHYRASDAAVDFTTASAAVNAFGAAGLTISQRLGDLSLSNDPTDYTGLGSFNNPLYRVSPADEINLVRSEAAFTNFFSNDFFGGLAQASSDVSLTQRIDYPHGTDAGFSYGRVDFQVSGNFSYSDLGNGWTQWSIDPLFLFDDRYDFNIGSSNPAIQAFARLQFHDLIYSFVNSGEWFGSYSGTFE